MIVQLTGHLMDVHEDSVVLERDGVAREVLVPPFAITELASHRGPSVTLHTLELFVGAQGGGDLISRMLGCQHPDDRMLS